MKRQTLEATLAAVRQGIEALDTAYSLDADSEDCYYLAAKNALIDALAEIERLKKLLEEKSVQTDLRGWLY